MGEYTWNPIVPALGLFFIFLSFTGIGQQTLVTAVGSGSKTSLVSTDLFSKLPGTALNLWEAGPATNGTSWQWGKPNFGATNSAHTPPTAWDVNLGSAYSNNAHCFLTSPQFNFNGIYHARLSLWVNYKTQANCDGFWLEYSIDDGLNWSHTGTISDPLAHNWYTTSNLGGTGQSAWTGNSGGWKEVQYDLNPLNNQLNLVKFRFVFQSDSTVCLDGASIDDFSILIPTAQEASLNAILSPKSGCDLNEEIVTVSIMNVGLSQINGGLKAKYQLNDTGLIVSENINMVIAAGGSGIYSFTTPVNLHVTNTDKNFNIKAWVSLVNDPDPRDDTASLYLISKARPLPPTFSKVLPFAYGLSANLTAIAANTVRWYSSKQGADPLYQGSTYHTFPLFNSTIFYAECIASNGCVSIRNPDTLIITHAPVMEIPFSDDFDHNTLFWTYAEPSTKWIRGIPGQGNYPDTVPTAPYLWGTNLNAEAYEKNANCALISPAFDFSNVVHGILSLKLKYHFADLNDGSYLEYSSDSGLSWSILGSLNDPMGHQWYKGLLNNQQAAWTGNSGGWQHVYYNLAQFDHFHKPVLFRLVFISDLINNDKGVFVDDFAISVPLARDAGLVKILQPLKKHTYCDDLSVKIILKNYGSDPLTYIPIKYDLNGISQGHLNWNGFLLPDSSVVVSFPSTPSPLNDYKILVYTALDEDLNYSNDSLGLRVNVEPPIQDVEVQQILEPNSSTLQGSATSVSLLIRNRGKQPVTNIPLGYSIYGTSIKVFETRTGPPLLQGETSIFTFDQPFHNDFLGYYLLCGFSLLGGDCYSSNDSSCARLEAATTTSVSQLQGSNFSLSQNFPNPSDKLSRIEYRLPSPGTFSFSLVNYQGQKMMSMTDKAAAGTHSLEISTADYPEGLYTYELSFEGKHLSKKMLIIHQEKK
ncbi:MAG: T9SS type A sorting domain-containing protein [Bacteroidota bacterium]